MVKDDIGFNNTDKSVGYALLEAWDEIVRDDATFAGVASLLQKYKRQTTEDEKTAIAEVLAPFRKSDSRARADGTKGDEDEPIEKSLRSNVKKYRDRKAEEKKAVERAERERLARAIKVVWPEDKPKTAWLFYGYDPNKNAILRKCFGQGKVSNGRTLQKTSHYSSNDFYWQVTNGTRAEWDNFEQQIAKSYGARGVEVVHVAGTPDYLESDGSVDTRPAVQVNWLLPLVENGKQIMRSEFRYPMEPQINDILWNTLHHRQWWDSGSRVRRAKDITTVEWQEIVQGIEALGWRVQEQGERTLVEVQGVDVVGVAGAGSVPLDFSKYEATRGVVKILWSGTKAQFVYPRDDDLIKVLGRTFGKRMTRVNKPGTEWFLAWEVPGGTRAEWADLRETITETYAPRTYYGEDDKLYLIEDVGEPKYLSEAERPKTSMTVVWVNTQAKFYFPASKNEILKKIIHKNFKTGSRVLHGKDERGFYYYYVYGGSKVRWDNLFKIAKDEAGIEDIIVEGMPKYDDAVASQDGMHAAGDETRIIPRGASMWFRPPMPRPVDTSGRMQLGGMYLLNAPHNDAIAAVLGKNGLKWQWHKPDCDATWDSLKGGFFTVQEVEKVKDDGKKEKVQIRSECVGCSEQVEKGVWYTADPFRAAGLLEFADPSARAQLEAEQRKLDDAYRAMLVERQRSWVNFAASAALRSAPNAPRIPVPPYFVDPRDKQRKPLAYLPFQEASTLQLADREATLLADEMGVGKTIQALGLINYDPSLQKIVILAPLVALYNWQEECQKWLIRCNPASTPNVSQRFKIQVLADEWKGNLDEDTNIFILNYEKLVTNRVLFDWLMSHEFDLLVADEIHYCRLRVDHAGDDEAASKVSRRCLRVFGWPAEGVEPERLGLVSRCRKRVFMTGTPIPNRPIEIWPLLNHLLPGRFRDRRVFGKAFCDLHKFVILNKTKTPVPDDYKADKKKGNPPAQEAWGGAGRRDSQGQQTMGRREAMQAMQAILRSFCMIRRMSGDVLDLPPKVREIANLKPDKNIEAALKQERDALEKYGESSAPHVTPSGDIVCEWGDDEGEDTSQTSAANLESGWARIQAQAQDIQAELDSMPPDSPEWKRMEAKRVELLGKAGIPFRAMSKTRRIMGEAKSASSWTWIETLLDSVTDKTTGKPIDKVVVFAYHNEVLNILEYAARKKYQALGKNAVVRIDGQVKGARTRQELKDAFQNDPNCKVFLGQVVAVSTAITLTAANHIVFVEQDWVPGTMQQAECRCWRIGQDKPVYVYLLVVDGSIDGNMAKTLLDKMDVQNSALNALPRSATVVEALNWIDAGEITLPGMTAGVQEGLPAAPEPVDDEMLQIMGQWGVESSRGSAWGDEPPAAREPPPRPEPRTETPPEAPPRTETETPPQAARAPLPPPPPPAAMQAAGITPYRAAVHAALRAVVASGRQVSPLAKVLAGLPSFATDKQVDAVLQDVRAHRDVVPAVLQGVIDTKPNPARGRGHGQGRRSR